MACIKAEQESSAAFLCILYNLLFGSYVDSIMHSVFVSILVALDLVCGETILLDALLKLVSPLSRTRHVRIGYTAPHKFWDLS